MPNYVALQSEAGAGRAIREIRAREDVSPLLIGVAYDNRRVSIRPQNAHQFDEDPLHPVKERRVVGAVGQVAVVLGDHGVVGSAVGVLLGEFPTGHRDRQLDVVGRVGGHEIDTVRFHLGQ
ncbi:MAG TPA: hypothetical protein VF371_00680, partial [Candidatus Limnocylindrales bacterium]